MSPFNEPTIVSGTLSVEDKKMIQTLESMALVRGHSEVRLLWEESRPCFPNNASVALGRLFCLKSRLPKHLFQNICTGIRTDCIANCARALCLCVVEGDLMQVSDLPQY